ncbi:hypothetical protein PG994_009361 [Apiospora phragmitis]|uniref:Uncharacterized protein n=1 Tax=Apiospora phragmitis TaxID=2905665 RepID=A0ABR1UJ34_9PEZI
MAFRCFSQLPCELRLFIWSEALLTETSNFQLTVAKYRCEARHAAQNYYSVKIEIINLEKAEKIVEKWCPKITGETVCVANFWNIYLDNSKNW